MITLMCPRKYTGYFLTINENERGWQATDWLFGNPTGHEIFGSMCEAIAAYFNLWFADEAMEKQFELDVVEANL